MIIFRNILYNSSDNYFLYRNCFLEKQCSTATNCRSVGSSQWFSSVYCLTMVATQNRALAQTHQSSTMIHKNFTIMKYHKNTMPIRFFSHRELIPCTFCRNYFNLANNRNYQTKIKIILKNCSFIFETVRRDVCYVIHSLSQIKWNNKNVLTMSNV